MSRIAKADVNNALQVAAKAILAAGGSDGRVSRAEMTAALKTLPAAQRPLADIFFKFIDNRDFKAGAQVTANDVKRAVEYAKTHLVAKYDLDNNGLSKSEIASMSLTGKRAVDLAKALKATAAGGSLDSAALGTAINKFTDKAIYISEGDSNAEYITANFAAGQALTGEAITKAFKGPLAAIFGSDLKDTTFEVANEAKAKEALKDLGTITDETDDYSTTSAKAFAEIAKLMNANLTDLRSIRVGPKDDDGSMKSDAGSYAELLVGRTKDGKLAGIIYTSVET